MDHTNTDAQHPVDRLAEEFAERLRRGEDPSVDEYASKHPQFADEIRDLFPALAEIEEAAPRPQTPLERWQPPERFGEFRIVSEIGRGGMGIVFEATQESLDRHVALKVLPPGPTLDNVQSERFLREAQSAARLHHTNIVPVFAVGEENGIPYYAMQYIHGRGLHEVLSAIQRRSPENGHLDRHSSLDRQTHDRRGTPDPAPDRSGSPDPAVTSAPDVRDKHPALDAMTSRLAAGLLSGNFAATVESDVHTAEMQTDEAGVETPPITNPRADDTVQTLSVPNNSHVAMHATYFRAVARIGIQIGEALSYAHSQGVLHRDIKPSNLYLDTHGTVWVMDFGLAKTEGVSDLTETGMIAGTLRYLPPERFQGKADARSDVYSLGLTLYELLTFFPAFEATDRNLLLQQVMEAKPSPPRRINPRIPRDLETIALKCLHKEPEGRYKTAKDLAEDLRRYLDGEPISARRPNLVQRGLMWIRRKPAFAASIFLAALTTMAVGALAIFFIVNRQLEASLARESQARKAASAAEEKAKIAEAKTKAALGKVRDVYYINNILLAQREWQNDNIAKSQALLDDCPADRRHWEWHYLRRRIHPSTPTIDHPAAIGPVRFSTDGKHIITMAADRKVRVWDRETRRQVSVLPYANKKKSAALSPDGKYLATYWFAKGSALDIYEINSGKRIRTLPLSAYTVRLSPDGRHLAIESGRNYEIWDWKDGVQKFRGNGKILFSADGSYFVSRWSTVLKSINRIRKIDGGELLQTLESKRESRNAVVQFSPNGNYACCYSAKLRAIDILDWRAKRRLSTFQIISSGRSIKIWSPDGAHLAVTYDNVIDIWDWRKKTVVRRLEGHTKSVSGLAFSPDGKTLASASLDKSVRLWDLAKPKPFVQFRARTDYWIRFSRDGRLLAAPAVDNKIQVRNSDSGQLLMEHDVPGDLTCCSLTADNKRLLAVCEGNLRDLNTGKLVRSFAADFRPVRFSIDGRYLMGNYGTRATGWGTKTFDFHARAFLPNIPRLYLQKDPPFGTLSAFSGDGHYMAVAFGQNRIVVAETKSGRRMHTLTCRPNRSLSAKKTGIHYISLNHDGSLLAVAHDGRALLWNLKTGKLLRTFTGSVRFVALHPDGKRLAVNSSGGVNILDVSSGQQLLFVKLPGKGASRDLTRLEFSPDGNRLAAMTIAQEITVWNAGADK